MINAFNENKPFSVLKGVALLSLTLILPLFINAQQVGYTNNDQNFFIGLDLGMNMSRLNNPSIARFNDQLNLKYTVKPAIGLYAKQKIIPRVYMKGSVLYSRKGADSYSPYLRLVNTYVDMSLLPQFQVFKDVYIQAGFCYSYLQKAERRILDGSNSTGIKNREVSGFESEKSIVAGLEIKLQNNINFEFNYYAPLAEEQTQNFQLGLNFLLNNKTNKKESPNKARISRSSRQIDDLKKGTLLVRLKTSVNTINAMNEMGLTDKAEKVESRQEAENKKIVAAFKEYYNFSDVVFFYSNNSGKVRDKDYTNIFLDDSLNIDPSVVINGSEPIFIADFGPLKQDTAQYYSKMRYQPDKNWSLEKKKEYYGGTNFGFQVLAIKDKNFVQLQEPFPFYVRTMYKSMKSHPEQSLFLMPLMPFQNWSSNAAVKELNKKLNRYYKKARRK